KFYIIRSKKVLKKFPVFKSCVVYDSTGKLFRSYPINVGDTSDHKLWDGEFLNITFSSQEFQQPQKEAAEFSEEMDGDAKDSDVSFVFPDSSVDSQRTSNLTEELEFDNLSLSNVTSDNEDGLEEQSLVAHKVVLSHWPYFKMMFESDFAEGGPGPTQITVRDTSVTTFKVLLRYMYTETIPVDMMPDHVYDSPLNNSNFSWEHIFLAADRYDIADLRDEAENRLIDSLDEKNSTDFLFRTAYMFEDLRSSVIDYIVENCGQLFISNHDSVDMFKDHPEFASIICEMYTALYEYHVKS
ncbi:hypothetical protein BGZ94_004424, partial [Podila epigama]